MSERKTYRQAGSDTTRQPAPVECPPFGVCVPAKVERVYDGDTVWVRAWNPTTNTTSIDAHAIRLIDCWCEELDSPDPAKRAAAERAKAYAEALLPVGQPCTVFVPFRAKGKTFSLMDVITMGRKAAHVFTDRGEVSSLMVEAGHATREKQ